MKKILFLLLHCTFFSYGQINLVLNYSFEDQTECIPFTGSTGSTLKYCKEWFTPFSFPPPNGGGSAELYSNCSLDEYWFQPTNVFGYQSPHSGNNYGGFYLIAGAGREYLENRLRWPLIVGKTYCVEFWYSYADKSQPPNINVFTNDIGVYFTQDSLMRLDSNYMVINVNPQVHNDSASYIIDTANWLLFSKEYIATGGEKYFTVGTFRKNSALTLVDYDSTLYTGGLCYVYVDDFSVKECTPTGVEEIEKEKIEWSISPNPTQGIAIISIENCKECIVEIHDVSGRKLSTIRILNNKTSIDCSSLASSIYFIKLKSEDGYEDIKKLTIQK
jgi:hypothetical protein